VYRGGQLSEVCRAGLYVGNCHRPSLCRQIPGMWAGWRFGGVTALRGRKALFHALSSLPESQLFGNEEIGCLKVAAHPVDENCQLKLQGCRHQGDSMIGLQLPGCSPSWGWEPECSGATRWVLLVCRVFH